LRATPGNRPPGQPSGLQSFVVGWMRWTFRVRGYWSLIVDDYPPFGFQE
jgi:hypothetical protein